MYKPFMITAVLFSVSAVAQSKLLFTYDSLGNQIERNYCPTGDCESGAKQLNEEDMQVINGTEEEIGIDFLNRLRIYPNPTKGELRIEWNIIDINLIKSFQVSDSKGSSSFIVRIQENENFVLIDLTNYASGTYFLEFTLNDSKRVIKQIIKN